jgi:hypothetical protein
VLILFVLFGCENRLKSCAMRHELPIAFAVCFGLSGCTGFDDAVEISDGYAQTPFVEYEDAGGSWRIWDKPAENRLRIGPSLARSFSAAFGQGVTFTDFSREEYQAAVEGFIASSGRSCTIADGRLLVSPQWEFRYSCR